MSGAPKNAALVRRSQGAMRDFLALATLLRKGAEASPKGRRRFEQIARRRKNG